MDDHRIVSLGRERFACSEAKIRARSICQNFHGACQLRHPHTSRSIDWIGYLSLDFMYLHSRPVDAGSAFLVPNPQEYLDFAARW
jgi:hypothetical protein